MKRHSFTHIWMLPIICATLILCLSYMMIESSGETIIVSQDGNGDYVNITDAVNAANASDTIRVWRGVYAENVFVNKTLSLIGNGSHDTTINANGTGSAVIINAPNSNITGFYCTNSGEAYNDAGIQVNMAGGCRIENNDCTGNGRAGIILFQSDNSIVRENTAASNPFAGIWLDMSAYATVSNNDCTDNSDGYGIFVMSSHHASVDNNTCTGSSNGISVSTATWTTIVDNDFHGTLNGLYLQSSDNITARNNDCFNTQGYGMRIEWCTTGTISDTTCVNNQMGGFYLRGSSHYTISDSTGSQSFADGMKIEDQSTHNTVLRCTFSNNVNHGVEIRNSAHITILNCSTIENENGVYVIESEGIEIHGSVIEDNNAYGVWAQSSSETTVDATDNDWGFNSGPYHETTNTEGAGNDVSDLVIYDPWKGKGIPDNHKPRVTWMYPHAFDEIKRNQQFTVWASDEDGNETIVMVQVAYTNSTWNSTWQDMELIDEDPDNLRWVDYWNTRNVVNGDYMVQARAYDGVKYSRTIDFGPMTVNNTDDDDDDEEEDDGDIWDAIWEFLEWLCLGGCLFMNASVLSIILLVRKKEMPPSSK